MGLTHRMFAMQALMDLVDPAVVVEAIMTLRMEEPETTTTLRMGEPATTLTTEITTLITGDMNLMAPTVDQALTTPMVLTMGTTSMETKMLLTQTVSLA